MAVGGHVLTEPSIRYVMVVAVHHEHRSRGLGREFVTAVVAHAQEANPGAAIFGLVAPDNSAMNNPAPVLGGSRGGDEDGYRVYRSPRTRP